MSAPMSARNNAAATAGAAKMMPPRAGTPRAGTPRAGTPRARAGTPQYYGPPKNPLLVKDEVGKAKASCYDLPENRFAYGRPGNHDSEGAREVSMFWVNHKPSPMPECPAPDFVWFNKRAASAKVTTARDLAFYRKESEGVTPRYGVGLTPRGGRPVIPRDLATYTYGKKVRPSTPIDDVMSHRFAEQAEDDLKKCYTEYRDATERVSSQVRKIPMTMASRGHAMRAKEATRLHLEEHHEEHFKLRKFQGAQTKINNGRQKSAHSTLLAQLIRDADRPSSVGGREASDMGDPYAGEAAPRTPLDLRQTM